MWKNLISYKKEYNNNKNIEKGEWLWKISNNDKVIAFKTVSGNVFVAKEDEIQNKSEENWDGVIC